MRMQIMIPSYHYFADPLRQTPYWSLYYATVLKQQSLHDISVFDCRTNSVDSIEESDCYVYWISKSGDAKESADIKKTLKNRYPNSRHVAGGEHVSHTQEWASNIWDCVLVGPGEYALLGACEGAGPVIKVDWKTCPFDNEIIVDRSFLPTESIVSENMFSTKERTTAIHMSRGCFYKCAYCPYNMPNYLDNRSGKLILTELEMLKEKYKISAVLLKDEICLNPNKNIFTDQMNALRESKLKWRGQTTSRGTTHQIEIAAKSGCQELSIGVETVSADVMKTVNKQWQTPKHIEEFLKTARQNGIKTKIGLIFGLPGEPTDIVDQTKKFIETHNPDFVNVSGFCPFPGTTIATNPEQFGIEWIDNDWSNYSHLIERYGEEENGLPFRYMKDKGPNTITIRNQVRELQNWLNDRGQRSY